MNEPEALRVSDLNLAESAREMVRWHRDHRVEEREDLLLLAGCDSFPVGYTNSVMALGPGSVADPERSMALADEFFGRLGRGYTVWIRGHLDAGLEGYLTASGLTSISNTPGMILEAPSPERSLDAGLEVELVTGVEGVRELAGVEAKGYATLGMPPEITAKGFSMPERLLNPYTLVALGRQDGEPAAAAIAILSHGVAGVYWVATQPEARGRGLGEACTRLVGNRALELGARAVVLQASQQGEPIYLRMGYREVTRYRWIVKPPP